MPVAHACNPSYSGGRDQEDRDSKLGQIVHKTLSRKTPSQERASGVAQGVRLKVQTSVLQKKKKFQSVYSTCLGTILGTKYTKLKKI
jgi:hypothetical protein